MTKNSLLKLLEIQPKIALRMFKITQFLLRAKNSNLQLKMKMIVLIQMLMQTFQVQVDKVQPKTIAKQQRKPLVTLKLNSQMLKLKAQPNQRKKLKILLLKQPLIVLQAQRKMRLRLMLVRMQLRLQPKQRKMKIRMAVMAEVKQ